MRTAKRPKTPSVELVAMVWLGFVAAVVITAFILIMARCPVTALRDRDWWVAVAWLAAILLAGVVIVGLALMRAL